MNPTNGLIAALRQKRDESDSSTSTGPEFKYGPKQTETTIEGILKSIDAKMDRILECVESGPGYEKEEKPNGYGHSDPGKY